MFVIPDEFLETTICDSCDKFLSVGPVKTYPNGKIKCGRCTREADVGAFTEFGLFGEQGWFKCINRFDGCRKLLSHDQVIDHESTCHSKIKKCPICPTNQHVLSYTLIKHFKERHASHILTTPSFRLELGNPPLSTFLYRLGDNLFFIKYQVHKGTVRLNAHYIGKKGHKTLTQKFNVFFGDIAVVHQTKTRPCCVDTEENSTALSIAIPGRTFEHVFVEFQLELGDLELALTGEESIVPAAKIGLPRTIHLYGDDNNPLMTVGPGSISLILRDRDPKASRTEYFMSCVCCQDVEPALGYSAFVETAPKTYRIFCSQCKWYAKENLRHWNMCETCTAKGTYEYSCVWREWGCTRRYPSGVLGKHESYCHVQPLRPCPAPGCSYKGTLPEIEHHFRWAHPKANFFLARDFLLINRSFHSDEVFYVWAYYDFIAVKVVPVEEDLYEVSLGEWKKAPESTAQRQPRIMIVGFNGTNTRMIKTKDSFVILDKGSRVHVSCFFTDRKTDFRMLHGFQSTKKLSMQDFVL